MDIGMYSARKHTHTHNCKYNVSTPIFVEIMQRFNLNNIRQELVLVFICSYAQ
jgi:hypothetical protein